MPRKTRMYVPGIPVHVVQRGHNRAACFFCDDDYVYYKDVLGEALQRYDAFLHAYCLMTNHIHLLLTPVHEDSIQRVFQHMGRQYAQYINRTYKRSGALWEGRHKGSLVCADNYLLSCYRYIELNPVTAGITKEPGEYPWSSYHANATGDVDTLLTSHQVFNDLGNTVNQRCSAYKQLFNTPLCDQDVYDIRVAIEKNQWVGDSAFKKQIEKALGRKLTSGKRGRPKL